MALIDSEKWDAVVKCDIAYDGIFFYGVKTTGIFCRPSCKSKIPRLSNVIFFDKAADALEYGLRPCKRCRPDLFEYNSMAKSMEKIKLMIDNRFADREALAREMKQIGISQNYFISLFRQQFDVTPVEYINKLRVERAKDMLRGTDANILHIALECGFGSMSTFYETFKKSVGVTPKEYRKNNNGEKE